MVGMLRRLRDLLRRAGLPWTDVALALFMIALAAWAAEYSGESHVTTQVLRPDVPFPPDLPERYLPPPEMHEEPEPIIVNLIAGAAVAVRRRLPLTSFLVAVGGLFLIQEGLTWPGFIAILICAYSAVAHGRSVAAACVVLAAAAATAASLFSDTIPEMPASLGPFLVLLPAGLGAAALRNARERADAAARKAAALEAEQEATARAAIAEERARIARDLHDVVSHHVSVMVIQAGAAGKVIESQPALAQGALGAIESSGREAMAELRHLLGLLAPADDQLHPQPGLSELDALVAKVRAAGQPVAVDREPGEFPPGVGLAAYRVVQEGLTNALRHAPGAATTVRLRRDGDALVVEVSNAPGGREPLAGKGAGRGLIGLGERVRLLDGTLDAGRSLTGGFRLLARIPLRTAS